MTSSVTRRWLVAWLGISLLILPTLLYVGNLPHSIPVMGQLGDWHYLGLVDLRHPYADNGFYRWAPIAAWGWQLMVQPLGIWLWTALHFAAVAAFRDWRASLLALASFPFWADLQNGSLIIFVVLAAWWALRGSRAGVIAYVALFALMPRPLMVPVLGWLLWQRTDARWALLAAGGGVVLSALALGQLGPWIGRLLETGGAQMASSFNLSPSILIGVAWLPIGTVLAVWLTLRRHFGLASLCASPYLLGYYYLFAVLELNDGGSAGGRAPADRRHPSL